MGGRGAAADGELLGFLNHRSMIVVDESGPCIQGALGRPRGRMSLQSRGLNRGTGLGRGELQKWRRGHFWKSLIQAFSLGCSPLSLPGAGQLSDFGWGWLCLPSHL